MAKKETTVVAKTKPAKKEAAAEKPKREVKNPGAYGGEREKDTRWCDVKVAIFKAMKALRCKDASSAKSAHEIAERAGIQAILECDAGFAANRVRHHCYGAKVSGLTNYGTIEGITGYGFWLTPKGMAIDPAKELKAQIAAKEAKKAAKGKKEDE